MREIITHELWIGNALDARDLRRVHALGVAAIVDLAYEEVPIQLTRGLIYCRFPLIDGAGNDPQLVSAAVEMVTALLRRQTPLLLACGAGMSRAPAIAAAALALIREMSPDECLQELIAGQPHDVSPTLWIDVKSAHDKLRFPTDNGKVEASRGPDAGLYINGPMDLVSLGSAAGRIARGAAAGRSRRSGVNG